jgi:hypothetical protein
MDENGNIKRATIGYWDHSQGTRIDNALKHYICEGCSWLDGKSLLQAELAYARDKQRLVDAPCETLVMLVGFSLEPLLQSVCVYKPQKVVLLLNQEGYGNEDWHVFARHVTEAIGHLKAKDLIEQLPHFMGEHPHDKPGYPIVDKPEAVFRKLVDALHEETDVVIDITGGKKSMGSGAYMYAAFAGARISYVDFDQYDPEKRRPYGYSCKIGELANPYQTFALREWERVRALYGQYQFQEARKVLNSLLPTIKDAIPDAEQPISKLAAFLDYYEKWDSGDYQAAKGAASALKTFEQPSAVMTLGEQWFEISGIGFTNKPKSLYGNLSALQAYVCDELARIRRLIRYNEDHRSAFLRAGGVNEILMLARVVRLVKDQKEIVSLLEPLEERTPKAAHVFKALLNPNKDCIEVKSDIGFWNAPDISIPRPEPMNPWWKGTKLFKADNGWETFLTRRNDLIHKYFPVPREWAEDALQFVGANFVDFLGHPMADLNLRTSALPWPELCDLCGLSRFLPASLRKEA